MENNLQPEEVVGQQVFIISKQPDSNMIGPVDIYLTQEAVETHFDTFTVSTEGELKLVHGIVTRADKIPKIIPSPLDIFLFISGAYGKDTGTLIDIDNVELLEETIIALLQQDIKTQSNTSINPIIKEMHTQTIEDLYVVYGYNIDLYFKLYEEEIDLEQKHICRELYKTLREA